ncbi:response regulator [Paenibacillus harenae]|uniref:response regulator n=1 Tax=Paenibacillus harenae TaxID=306543 RepID=UPI003CCBE963
MDKMEIIILTAREEVDDRVKALNLGVDDYIIKPFSSKELTAYLGQSTQHVSRVNG